MSLVGKPVERIEDLRLLRGRGQYVDDLHREGMLHAAILRSSVAHGRLVAVEVSTAETMPGVRAVFTAEDLANRYRRFPCALRRCPSWRSSSSR